MGQISRKGSGSAEGFRFSGNPEERAITGGMSPGSAACRGAFRGAGDHGGFCGTARTAVFSDIHGNIYALEEMLRQLENAGVGQFIFCGDIMGYFPWQEEVIERLRQLPNLHAVLGNHDSYYIHTADQSPERLAYAKKYGMCYLSRLSAGGEGYLQSLPSSIELNQAGKRILIVHGSVGQHLEGRVYADTEVDESAYGQYAMVIAGHTHYQMHRKVKDTALLNPGSLGQPRDHKGYSYCLLDIEKGEALFQTVRIDSAGLLAALTRRGESRQLINYMQLKVYSS